MRSAMFGCAVALIMLGGACDVEQVGRVDTVRLRPSTGGGGTGGWYLNTNALGKYQLSELDLAGATHDGVRLDSVEVQPSPGTWITLDAVSAVGGEIRGSAAGVTYTGAELVASRWHLTLFTEAGELSRTMWIDAHVPVADGPPGYVFKYDDEQGTPTFLCPADEHGTHEVFALADLSVDPDTGAMSTRAETLYLACTSGAVGKANTWGYVHGALDIADFEAAVRVVRADYCGDGVSWTVPGLEVQLVDAWGVNTFVDPTTPTEAVWGDHGALCLSRPRNAAFLPGDVTCDGAPLPLCEGAALADYAGALVWTKTPS